MGIDGGKTQVCMQPFPLFSSQVLLPIMWGCLHSQHPNMQNVDLIHDEHVMGRSESCATQLPHDPVVSNQHCVLRHDRSTGTATIKDVSTNGTYLNKKKVPI